MMQTQERTIDGHTYSVTQLPGMQSWRLLNRLARLMAPGLTAIKGDLSNMSLLDLELGDLGRAVPMMLEQLPEDEQERVTRLLLESCLVDNAPLLPKFNTHFQGRPFTIGKVVMFALEVNYGSFQDALAASGLARGTRAPRSLSEMLNTSAGPPNGSSGRESQPAAT